MHHFEVGEYVHHVDDQCKYRVFENGKYVASFTPDEHDFLHICENPAGLDEEFFICWQTRLRRIIRRALTITLEN